MTNLNVRTHPDTDQASEICQDTMIIKTSLHAVLRDFGRISHAIYTAKHRPAISGINLKNDDGENFTAIATDGHRLAKVRLDDDWEPLQEFNITLAHDFVKAIQKIKYKATNNPLASATFEISADQKTISFEYFGGTITGDLLETQYPDSKRVFPTEFVAEATFNPAYLRDFCKVVLSDKRLSGKEITIKLAAGCHDGKVLYCDDDHGGEYVIMAMRDRDSEDDASFIKRNNS